MDALLAARADARAAKDWARADAVRDGLCGLGFTIEDTPQFYDMEVFNRCVQTHNPLMTLECWSEVHPSLVTLPVDWDFTIPYGILYALHPDGDTLRFLDLVREQMEQANGA